MKNVHVLLVDDDSQAQETMAMILEMDGYRVSLAGSGQQALLRLADPGPGVPPVDFLVVDLEMGNLSGIELIGELNRRGHTLPVMVVTGFASKATVVELMRRGVSDYLDKPVQMEEFRQRIDLMARGVVRGRAPALPPIDVPVHALGTHWPWNPAREVSGPPLTSGIDTSGFGFPSSFRRRSFSQAGRTVALACRKEHGFDVLVAEVEAAEMEAFYQIVLIKSCFDAHRSGGYDAQAFVRMLNKTLLEGSLGAHSVNAQFVRVFADERRMEIIHAGHPYFSLLPAGGSPRPVFSAGGALGVGADLKLEPRILPVDSGDRFFLYTRGFWLAAAGQEARQQAVPGGVDDLIGGRRGESLESTVERVWRSVEAAEGSRDDTFFWGIEIP